MVVKLCTVLHVCGRSPCVTFARNPKRRRAYHVPKPERTVKVRQLLLLVHLLMSVPRSLASRNLAFEGQLRLNFVMGGF